MVIQIIEEHYHFDKKQPQLLMAKNMTRANPLESAADDVAVQIEQLLEQLTPVESEAHPTASPIADADYNKFPNANMDYFDDTDELDLYWPTGDD
jgi:hypothetical protein